MYYRILDSNGDLVEDEISDEHLGNIKDFIRHYNFENGAHWSVVEADETIYCLGCGRLWLSCGCTNP